MIIPFITARDRNVNPTIIPSNVSLRREYGLNMRKINTTQRAFIIMLGWVHTAYPQRPSSVISGAAAVRYRGRNKAT